MKRGLTRTFDLALPFVFGMLGSNRLPNSVYVIARMDGVPAGRSSIWDESDSW